jgi:transposase-like protein
MTPPPNMRELSEFSRKYLQGNPQAAVGEIARAFGIEQENLKPSWRAVIAAQIEDFGIVRGPARGTGLRPRP